MARTTLLTALVTCGALALTACGGAAHTPSPAEHDLRPADAALVEPASPDELAPALAGTPRRPGTPAEAAAMVAAAQRVIRSDAPDADLLGAAGPRASSRSGR